jgi:hypothetical protein
VGGVVIKIVESFFGDVLETHVIEFNKIEGTYEIECKNCFIADNISTSDLQDIAELFSKDDRGRVEGYFALSCDGAIFQHA